MAGDYVLLAFSDKEPVKHSDRLFKENFIGGRPYFSPEVGQEAIDACLNPRTLTCGGCQSVLSFIAQINCPVDDDNDRCIHIFACVRKSCSSRKWLVTRTVSPFIDVEPESKEKKGDSEWLSDQDDWGEELPVAAKNVNQKPRKTPSKTIAPSLTVGTDEVHVFQSFYLTVEEEEYLLQSDRQSEPKGGKFMDRKDLLDQEVGQSVSGDAYEKFLIPGTDDVSNKFIKRISKFPDQVIRYNLDGQPLLNQRTKVSPANCTMCGSSRRFELQLTPGLINALTLTNSGSRNEHLELDFGTVLVFTCERDCGSTGVLVEEAVVLLDADEDVLQAKVHQL